MKYNGLYDLIDGEIGASDYFESLPDYVRETISERANNICTIEELKDYAENLLRGDD